MVLEGEFEGFTVEEVLTRSGTTTVFRAFQQSLKRTVLIKELRPELFEDADILHRFQREAQVCALIKHENIVDIYDYTVKSDRIFLVMEYVSGCSLTSVIQNTRKPPIDLVLAIILQTLRGLAFAHSKGVIHRDLKPSNILLAKDGWVKITDFGLSLYEGSPVITQPGAVVGTPAYLAPEAINGGAVTSRSDIFSLGATFYQLLTGEKPFYADHFTDSLKKVLSYHPPELVKIRTDIPPELDRIVLRMLEKQPGKRWASASDILAELEKQRLLAELDDPKRIVRRLWEEPQRESSPQRAFHRSKANIPNPKRFSRWALALILLAILVVGYSIISPTWRTSEPPANDSTSMARQVLEDTLNLAAGKSTNADSAALIHQNAGKKNGPEQKGSQVPHIGVKADETSQAAKSGSESKAVSGTVPKSAPATQRKGNQYASSSPGRLRIKCDPWAYVTIDEKMVGLTPFGGPLELSPGAHKLQFQNSRFPTVFKDVEVRPNEEKELFIDLWAEVGRLAITVDTWAEVYIDDIKVGETPINNPQIVSLGTHKITLKNPAFQTWEKTVTFQHGDSSYVLNVELKSANGSSSPPDASEEARADSSHQSSSPQPAVRDSLSP